VVQWTRYPWHVQRGKARSGDLSLLGPGLDSVETSASLGMTALERLLEESSPVGPVLECLVHTRVLVPVPSGTADWWEAAHSTCRRGVWECECSVDPHASRCVLQWLAPGTGAVVTEPQRLHESLSMCRSRPRSSAA